MSCHAGKLAQSHPEGSKGNCVGCHMTKQNAKDGGHTVFTDHRISRRPGPAREGEAPEDKGLIAWREPPAALQERNLALAYANAGLESGSMAECLRGYRMLVNLEKEFPDDPEVLTALGRVLLLGNQSSQATELFERVLKLGPDSAVNEMYAGSAYVQSGQLEKAVEHLERSIQLDPLLLPAAEALVRVYRQQNDMEKLSALSDHIRQALGSSAPQEGNPPSH
jgi:predicted Zn-dependent protease